VARTVDQVAHALRRDEFLDVAQRLLETKGYEQMSIQDVLGELGTSKGAFYHYFGSKQALLEAVVQRLADAIAAALTPIADDADVLALDKLLNFFSALSGWKVQRRDLLVSLTRVWCSDDNAVLRQKLRPGIAERIAPLLADIIGQGVQEGVFTVAYPDQMGRVVVSLVQDLNDRLAELVLAAEPGQRTLRTAEHAVAAYTDALERILGVPAGSVVLVKTQTLRPWFNPERF
jgi:AcrR family transcriptional regulator